MFGVGPGALPSDAVMLGIDPLRQRDMQDEALSVILPLLRGETVTHKSDWFSLDARCSSGRGAVRTSRWRRRR